MSDRQTKIKLVAVAKDEAAYLAEWVFHHKYFGFDSIEILLNRTSDKSERVLAEIVRKYPNVTYRSVDWIDTTPPSRFIQYIAYADAFERAKTDAKYTHICFLDIDEYWTPTDFKSTPKSFIENNEPFSTMSFNWLNVLNEKPFADLPASFHAQPAPTVKSFINLDTEIIKIQLHLPEVKPDKALAGHILSDGRPFVHSKAERQRLCSSLKTHDFPAYVLHRKFRSEEEYIAMLLKGRPSDDAPFKLNRPGYITADKSERKIDLPEKQFQRYILEKAKFTSELPLGDLIAESRQEVLGRSLNCVEKLKALNIDAFAKYDKDIKRIFSGLEHSEIRHEIESKSKATSASSFRNRDLTHTPHYPMSQRGLRRRLKALISKLLK